MFEVTAGLTLFFLLVFLLYFYWTINFNYWKKRNVPHPPYSLLGNMGDVLFMRRSIGEVIQEIYDSFEGLNYIGIYKVRRPGIVIRDAKLAERILVKEFSSFHDNDILLYEQTADLFSKNPFILRGEKWKSIRQQLKMYFTPRKLRMTVPIMSEVAKTMVDYIDTLNKDNKQKEAKYIVMRFTVQNIAACAFDIKADDGVADLFWNSFNVSFGDSFRGIMAAIMPDTAYFMRIRMMPQSLVEYFRKVYMDVLRQRIAQGIIREDYMNVLVEGYKKSLFSEEDVVAQAFTLYLNGTETTSQSIITTLYELASNPEKQDKLKEEIDKALTEELTYELLQEMKYLDCVVREAQRLHPPLPVLSKICTKPFKLPPVYKNGGLEVTLEPGSPVLIPVKAFHLDSTYYPDSKKFCPERFLDGTKDPWLTFGDGPRICLGMRFALLQVKVCLVHIVKNFKVKLNKRTTVPLHYVPAPLFDLVQNGIWLDFERRVSNQD